MIAPERKGKDGVSGGCLVEMAGFDVVGLTRWEIHADRNSGPQRRCNDLSARVADRGLIIDWNI